MPQRRFLYIEDHPASRRVLEIMLRDMLGYEYVRTLPDTEDVINRIGALGQPFDVIFLDLNLTPLDGYTVCELLREHPVYCQATIIGLTASVTPAQIRRMQSLGFNGVLGKPINHTTFPLLLERILDGQSVWEEA